jgi:predicted pyridoxine 5'-phosphate oxidase superfamily flavin-nucleotide-binding protein
LPWHGGEIALQTRLGVAERMDMVGRRVIRDHLIAQHRDFYSQLPFVALGAVDHAGAIWATIRAGQPGFLHAPDATRLDVDAPRDSADPAENGMDDGAAIALLGIDPATRRRNRLNGTIRRDGPDGFAIAVAQSFGNCPRYIHARTVRFARDPRVPAATPGVATRALDDRARAMIAAADTFFVATYVDRADGTREVDVSHRGGRPGFARVEASGVVTIPDFAGNLFFNTLGNIVANPRAGLVFVDVASGDLLQMTGAAEVLLDSPEIAAFPGAERLWRFTPEAIVFRAEALPLRFDPMPAG